MLRTRRGSTLLLLMVITGFMTILVWALDRAIGNRLAVRYRAIPKMRAQTTARAALSYWLYYRKSGVNEIELKNDARLAKYLHCGIEEKNIELAGASERGLPFRKQLIRANCPPKYRGFSYPAFLTYLEQNYTDYLISSLGDLVLSGIPEEGRFFLGPVFAGGDLVLREGGHHFFVKKEWNTKPILAARGIQFWDKWRDFKEELRTSARQAGEGGSLRERRERNRELELISKVSELINPIYTGFGDFIYTTDYPLRRVTLKRQLDKEWNRFQSRGRSKVFDVDLPRAMRLTHVAFGPIFSYGRSKVDEEYYLKTVENKNGEPRRIPNAHLLEKRLVGLGNGITRSFTLPRGHSRVGRVFLKDLSRLLQEGESPPLKYPVHPVRDLEGVLRNEFTVHKNILTFKRKRERTPLRLPPEAFNEIGKIRFRSPSTSAMSSARDVDAIYLEYLGRAKRLDERHFRINDHEGVIRIMDPDLHKRMWVHVAVTDGVRRSFQAPINFGEVIYLDGREADARVIPGSIIFNSTPKPGQDIHVMVLRPRLYAQKSPPGYQVGVYIDRDVGALALDLGRIFPAPTFGLLVSEVPLYLHGEPNRNYTIISTQDVYLGSINERNPNGNFVFIISNGMIWGQRGRRGESKRSIELNRVIAMSASDGLYLNLSEDHFGASRDRTEKSIFKGSLFLQGTLKNLFFYPDLDERQGYYYHPGRQADFQFFYDEGMQDRTLLPLFMPTSFKVVKRKN